MSVYESGGQCEQTKKGAKMLIKNIQQNACKLKQVFVYGNSVRSKFIDKGGILAQFFIPSAAAVIIIMHYNFRASFRWHFKIILRKTSTIV